MSPQFLASNYRLIATIPYLCVPAALRKSGAARRLLRPPPVAFSSSLLLVRPAFPAFRPSRSTRSHAANNEARVRSPPRTRAHPFSRPFLRLSLSLSLTPSVFCPTLSNAHKCARNACTCPDTLNGARPFYSPRSVPLPERLPLSS